MRIRLAAPRDAEEIRRIYNAEVEGDTNTFDLIARTSEEQATWLERHQGAHPAIVAIDDTDSAVLGFGALTPFRSRPAYATSVENSVYVDVDQRGKGVGKALLEELLVLATRHGFHTVIARIVGENQTSIALHTGRGFSLVGTEREIGRKHGRWLDVVELQKIL